MLVCVSASRLSRSALDAYNGKVAKQREERQEEEDARLRPSKSLPRRTRNFSASSCEAVTGFTRRDASCNHTVRLSRHTKTSSSPSTTNRRRSTRFDAILILYSDRTFSFAFCLPSSVTFFLIHFDFVTHCLSAPSSSVRSRCSPNRIHAFNHTPLSSRSSPIKHLLIQCLVLISLLIHRPLFFRLWLAHASTIVFFCICLSPRRL
jgi:hypothetical protein